MASADNVFNIYANQMAARFPEDNFVGDSAILEGITAELEVLVDALSLDLDALERRALALRVGDVQDCINRYRKYRIALRSDQDGLERVWGNMETGYRGLVDFVRAFGNSDNAEVYSSEEKDEQ